MRRHPPPAENEKRPFGAPTPGPLTTDKLKCRPQHTGSQTPLSCPPFTIAQPTQNDKGSDVLCRIGNVEQGDYIPGDSPGQIPARIVQIPTKAILATLAALMIRERARFIAAGDNGDDEAFADSFDRLLPLYESWFVKRREAVR